MFYLEEALNLRLVCREMKKSVGENHDGKNQRIKARSVPAWKACFPNAAVCSISGFLQDAITLRGLRGLDLSCALGVTDAPIFFC